MRPASCAGRCGRRWPSGRGRSISPPQATWWAQRRSMTRSSCRRRPMRAAPFRSSLGTPPAWTSSAGSGTADVRRCGGRERSAGPACREDGVRGLGGPMAKDVFPEDHALFAGILDMACNGFILVLPEAMRSRPYHWLRRGRADQALDCYCADDPNRLDVQHRPDLLCRNRDRRPHPDHPRRSVRCLCRRASLE